MSTLMLEIVEHKRRRRIALAALPFPEKVRIVEQMREALTHLKTSGVSDVRPTGLISGGATRPTEARPEG